MGIFDSLSELFEAATPWSTVEAEAPVTTGGASSTKTPADAEGEGEGEAKDASGPTPDKRAAASSDDSDDKSSDDSEEPQEEEEEEEEPEDPKEKLEEECKESKQCSPAKHHYDECVERVTSAEEDGDQKGPKEDCVEEFFHLAHCATQCAAPKLWQILK